MTARSTVYACLSAGAAKVASRARPVAHDTSVLPMQLVGKTISGCSDYCCR